MKLVLFAVAHLFLFAHARADVVSCATADVSVKITVSLNPTNPGTVQITSAEARLSLFNKSETRQRKYVGHGRAPRVRQVLHSGSVIEVRARGGVMGEGAVLVLPKAPLMRDHRGTFLSTYVQSRPGLEAKRVDLVCFRRD